MLRWWNFIQRNNLFFMERLLKAHATLVKDQGGVVTASIVAAAAQGTS